MTPQYRHALHEFASQGSAGSSFLPTYACPTFFNMGTLNADLLGEEAEMPPDSCWSAPDDNDDYSESEDETATSDSDDL